MWVIVERGALMGYQALSSGTERDTNTELKVSCKLGHSCYQAHSCEWIKSFQIKAPSYQLKIYNETWIRRKNIISYKIWLKYKNIIWIIQLLVWHNLRLLLIHIISELAYLHIDIGDVHLVLMQTLHRVLNYSFNCFFRQELLPASIL